MSVEQTELYSLSRNAAFDAAAMYRYHGDGSAGDSCGHLRAYGHAIGEKVHARIALSRCKRWDCPECWDKPNGALDREATRILSGIFPDEPNRTERDLTELIVTPSCEAGMLREPLYRREIIQRLRKAYGAALVPPGAWVYHESQRQAPDRCPQAPHLHVFVRRMPDTRSNPTWGLYVEIRSIPGLRTSLRSATRVLLSPGMRGGRGKAVAWIGWFGRRASPGKPKDASGKPIRLAKPPRYCELCHADVPAAEWARVSFRRFRPEKEEWREEPQSEVTFLSSGWRGEE